ncbi:MAG: hypothetical protein WD712_02450 [Candidatus Spechtbacterales bacterium]
MNFKHRKTYKVNKLLLIAAGMFFAVYAVISIYNVSLQYTIEEMEKDLAQLEKENTQFYINQTQSSSLDRILNESERLSYTDVGKVSYVKKPSVSPFAVLSAE